MADNCLRTDVNCGKIVPKRHSLPPRKPHWRRCWDCGNVAQHADSITPHVLCKECKSQDTRKIEAKPCPFCGKDAEITAHHFEGKKFADVGCSDIDCRGHDGVSIPPMDKFRETLSAWNKRAN